MKLVTQQPATLLRNDSSAERLAERCNGFMDSTVPPREEALLSCPTLTVVIDVDGVVKVTRSRHEDSTTSQERREP